MKTAGKSNGLANQVRSRRALLAGALGGVGAWFVSAAGRAMPAEAAAGSPVLLGRVNSSGSLTTELRANTTQPVIRAVQVGGGNAVRGEATNGRGVVGIGGSAGTGVWAYSPNHNAIFAKTDTGFCVNARAEGANSTAVFAHTIGANGKALVTGGPSELHGDVLLTQGTLTVDVSAAPVAPTQGATLFVQAVAGNKVRLAVLFPTGAVQVLANEP